MELYTDGSDYSIAKTFLTMFPECQSFTDKEISIKLSEDLYIYFAQKSIECVEAMMSSKDSNVQARQNYLQENYNDIMRRLRSYNNKKTLIAEIKMIR